MNRPLWLFGGFVLVLFTTPLCAAEPTRPTTRGKLLYYDAERQIARLAVGRLETTFALDPKLAVIIDEKPAKLADIPLTTNLLCYLNQEKSTITEIRLLGSVSRKTIRTLDVEKKEIHFERDSATRVYCLSEKLKVTKDEQPITLADLKPEQVVVVTFSALNKLEIVAIKVAPPKK